MEISRTMGMTKIDLETLGKHEQLNCIDLSSIISRLYERVGLTK